MLQMSRRDIRLTISVLVNSTNPISTSALTCSASAASENSLAMTADMVYCGASNDSVTFGSLPITMVTAMVSPSARPKPNMMAPAMPVRA